MHDNNGRDYYCNNKFKFLKVDIEKNVTYNCHAATPHPIDIKWLEQNPGQLFNSDISTSERHMMLKNVRNNSCEQNCWQAEDVGASGPRILGEGYKRTHDTINTMPETLDITIGGECNLTCSYCCKVFSSAWRNDIHTNGNYVLSMEPDRYSETHSDRVLRITSQQDRLKTKRYSVILKEIDAITKSDNLKTVIISGGEPLLNNWLFDILEMVKDAPTVKIFTGLGANVKRLEKLISLVQNRQNIMIAVSAENTREFYNFNRYGILWEDFEQRLQLIKDSQINFIFNSVLSNLTIFGFADFYNKFNQHHMEFDLAYQPTFMPPYVIDPASKDKVKRDLSDCKIHHIDNIITSLDPVPTEEQRINTRIFLKEFIKRRPDLDIKIFPKTFLDWLE